MDRPRRLVWMGFAGFALIALITGVRLWEPDVWLYQHYAQQALAHHRVPPEYPILSLPIFFLPFLLPLPYGFAFGILTILALAVLLNIGTKRHGARWGLKLLGYLSLSAIGIFTQRYDIFVALIGFLSVDAALRRRYRSAWAFSLIGFGLKLWPVLLWPVFLIAEWRETGRIRWDRLGWSALGAGVLMGIPALLSPGQAFTTVRYLVERPVEIESVAASLTALVQPIRAFYSFGSLNITADGWAHPIALMVSVAGIAGVLTVLWAQWKGRMELVDAAILTLGIVLLTTKVFSAQYLIWLAPWLALKKGNRGFVLAYALTALSYPVGFMVPGLFPWIIVIAGARNAALAAGFVLFVRRLRVPAAQAAQEVNPRVHSLP